MGEGGGAKAEVSVKVEARPGLGYCTARATVAVVDLAAVAEALRLQLLAPVEQSYPPLGARNRWA